MHEGKLAMDRITPAYAGKSFVYRKGFEKRWDHPRLCGEKDREPIIYNGYRGSPPPMRGKAIDAMYHALYTEDHPRLCGEKTLTDSGWIIPTGSPPPMRGKGQARRTGHRGTGITPAYAGKRKTLD